MCHNTQHDDPRLKHCIAGDSDVHTIRQSFFFLPFTARNATKSMIMLNYEASLYNSYVNTTSKSHQSADTGRAMKTERYERLAARNER